MSDQITTVACSEPDCTRRMQARGLCNPHYKRAQRSGTLPPRRRRDPMITFWSNVEKTQTCWIWQGNITRYGYGQFSPRRGANHRAHKVAWESENGPVPDGMVLDHLCRNRSCVRPGHLEPVTPRINALRGIGPSALNSRKMRCRHGHPFSPENTRIDAKGKRVCRTCDRARWERSNAKRKAQRHGEI